MTDYYSDFREDLRSSLLGELGEWGSFDPLILSVTLAERIELGVPLGAEVTKERLFGWGTYLHENMHWYQCIGTTYGVMRLLSSMAQTFVLFRSSRLTSREAIAKPLYKFLTDCPPSNQRVHRLLNMAVNTWMDLEFTNAYFESPVLHAERIAKDPFFVGIDHGALMYLQESVGLLTGCFPQSGRANSFIKGLRLRVADGLENADAQKVVVPPVGASEIMESAARISEVQYLQHASGGRYSWTKYQRMGYLDSRYLSAFNLFLQATRLSVGDDPCSPVVNLFLLVCDIALNPTLGYPDVLNDTERFTKNWHPGFRFLKLCSYLRTVRNAKKWDSLSIAEDFEEFTNEVCSAVGFDGPVCVANKCIELLGSFGVETIVQQVTRYETRLPNLPVRYVIGKHAMAMKERTKLPFFPSMPASFVEGDLEYQESIDRVMASLDPPFVRRKNRGIEPVLPRYAEYDEGVLRTFQSSFTKWLLILSLGRQLAARRGPFVYALPWVDSSKTADELSSVVAEDFGAASGYSPVEINILG
jgi:hypothetical protein